MSGRRNDHEPSGAIQTSPSTRDLPECPQLCGQRYGTVEGRPSPLPSLIPISTSRGVTRTRAAMPSSQPAATRAEFSVLQSASQVDITGGNFSTVGANQVTVTINLPGDQTHNSDQSMTSQSSSQIQSRSSQDTRTGDPTHTGDNGDRPRMATLPVQRSCDIYYRHLAVKGRGSPLWIPAANQNLDISYQREGVLIGDVGLITDSGSFDFLFNIRFPHDHAFNRDVPLPENFTPFFISRLDIERKSEFEGSNYLSSTSVKKSRRDEDIRGLSFECSASEGAILAMPAGSNSEDLRNMASLHNYVAANVKHWYKYIIEERGRYFHNGDVRLVTGWDKTTTWGMATFFNTTTQKESFRLKFQPVGEGRTGTSYGWEYSGFNTEVRSGPSAREIERLRTGDHTLEGVECENQCLFIRTLNISIQNKIWTELTGNAPTMGIKGNSGNTFHYYPQLSMDQGSSASAPPYYSLPSDSRSGLADANNNFLEMVTPELHSVAFEFPRPQMTLTEHPSNYINKLLMELDPSASVAITEDKHWISVIREDDNILPATEELYARILESSVPYNDEGVMFLLPKRTDLPVIVPAEDTSHLQALSGDNVQQHVAQSNKQPMPRAVIEKKNKKKALLIGCQRVRQEPAEFPVLPGRVTNSQSIIRSAPATGSVARLKGVKTRLMAKVTKKDTLKGPHRDVKAMRDLLIEVYKYDPADIVALVDDDDPTHKQPTLDNIMDEIKKLVEGAVDHDRFFFHFSGHSVQEDTDDIEEEDRKNEFILTSDGKTIKDDVLKATLVDPLPKNSSLIAVFDSCHSGTLLDLKHFRCNRVYVPWVNNGQRRSASRWIETYQRQARVSTRDQPPIMRTMAQKARWSQTFLDRVFLPNKESITSQTPYDSFAHNIIPHGLPLSETETLSLITDFQSLSSFSSTEPMWLESPTAGEKQYSIPVDLYCSGFCRGHALSPDNTQVSADVVSISCARESQLTWEDSTGASVTHSLVNILRKDPHPSYTDLMKLVSHDMYTYYVDLHTRAQKYRNEVREKNIERIKRGKMPKEGVEVEMNNFQNPQLSSDRPWNMDRRFYP